MPRTKTPRDLSKYQVLPPLEAETYAGLKANVAANGIQVPIVRDEQGNVLDGFARATAVYFRVAGANDSIVRSARVLLASH